MITIGNASGAAGQQVVISATLASGAGRVAALQTNLTFDSTRVGAVLNTAGQPDCTIESTIGPGTAADKILAAALPSSPPAQQVLVVAIFGINQNLIPDGAIYSCRFQIAAGSMSGSVPLDVAPTISDPAGNVVPVVGVAGSITVTP